jgi:hypothetical protein
MILNLAKYKGSLNLLVLVQKLLVQQLLLVAARQSFSSHGVHELRLLICPLCLCRCHPAAACKGSGKPNCSTPCTLHRLLSSADSLTAALEGGSS